MPVVDVKVYYLEMLAQPKRLQLQSAEGLTVLRAVKPSVADYRLLYNAVGNEYHWRSRAMLSDADLATLIQDPLDEVHVLHVDGNPAGFAELDRRNRDEIELVQFGLMPEFIGRRPGEILPAVDHRQGLEL